MDPKELTKRISELKKKLEDLESKRSEAAAKKKSLYEKLEDRTMNLFDRAVRALGPKAETAKQRNQKIYDAMKEAGQEERELTEEVEELRKDLIALQIQERRFGMEKVIRRGEELLKEGQKGQHEGGLQSIRFLKEAALLARIIENGLASWEEEERIDRVRVIVLDPVWRRKMAGQQEEIIYASRHQLGDTRIEGFREINPQELLYDIVPFKSAVRLEKQGKCRIDRSGEQPKFEKVWRRDPDPPILADLYSINLGRPLSLGGKLSSEMEELVKKGSSGTLTVSSFIPLLTEQEIENYRKKFE